MKKIILIGLIVSLLLLLLISGCVNSFDSCKSECIKLKANCENSNKCKEWYEQGFFYEYSEELREQCYNECK